MKKLLKSEIYGSVNSAWDPHVAENWLKSQTFLLKKKKKKAKTQTCVWETQNALPKRTLTKYTHKITSLEHSHQVCQILAFGTPNTKNQPSLAVPNLKKIDTYLQYRLKYETVRTSMPNIV